ncbi:uncharacterized protein Z518_00810 [Rhinocladiella mackenziei CBS 650.93]|uniref:Apple domain-containing protein n=1 Tax=Rhinocladiella mackenziei CBS 650.93 TaxID=1442369 RepID=A0A0D2IUH9_9EURO|nr:uncharacterized protein Z518_00810 [Rhinocladiella mackenziei CBS 650.93]KIX09729.1 hypothetical protein Z518_00810 [Rhinocladiella mackenziei CBS 650.93]
MSRPSATSSKGASDQLLLPTQPSSGMSDKFPVADSNQSYPEVAPEMTQPPLETYQQPNSGSTQHPYQYQNGYVPPPGDGPVSKSPKPNPWGLSPLAFGLLVATVTAIIVGGAVGGGVAGAMSNNDSDSSSAPVATVTITADGSSATGTTSNSSSSDTSTSALPLPSSLQNYVAPEPYYVGTLENPGCTDDNSRIEVQYDTSFDLFCGVDMSSSLQDDTDTSLVVADFTALFAYSITDCLYACSNAIYFVERWGQDTEGGNMQSCKGVTWNYQMAQSNTSDNANCWLKNGTSTGYQCNTCISAKLVQ